MAETETHTKEKELLLLSLEEFLDKRRSEYIPTGKTSVELAFGTIGYRKLPDKVEVSKETADLLISRGLGALVKVTKEPIKTALKNLSAEELAAVEAKKVPGAEQFFAKANEIRYTASEKQLKNSLRKGNYISFAQALIF